MGKEQRGTRDGSGPYEESFQMRAFGIGRRKQRGEPCPKEDNDKE